MFVIVSFLFLSFLFVPLLFHHHYPRAQRQTTRASVTILDAGIAATAHVRFAEHTGVKAEPMPEVLAQ